MPDAFADKCLNRQDLVGNPSNAVVPPSSTVTRSVSMAMRRRARALSQGRVLRLSESLWPRGRTVLP